MTDERDEEILRLMEVEKLKARTVAQRLGISDSTVSRAWRRALDRRSQQRADEIEQDAWR